MPPALPTASWINPPLESRCTPAVSLTRHIRPSAQRLAAKLLNLGVSDAGTVVAFSVALQKFELIG